jgi:drug/metabolite transporter (DMT)-like permease
MAACLLLWSAAFPAITYALRTYEPLSLLATRLLLASALLVALASGRRLSLPRGWDWLRLVVAGGVGWLGYNALLFQGQRTVQPGSAAFITNLAPLIATGLAWLFLKERPPRAVLVALLFGVVGVTLIAMGEGRSLSLESGVLWVLLASCCSSSATVMLKPLLKRHSPFEVTCYVIWSATLLALPLWPRVPGALWSGSVGALAVVLYLGAVLAVTAILWNQVIRQLPVARASAATYFIPVLAVAFSAATLGVFPTGLALLGGALVIGGQWIAWFQQRRLPAPPATQ